MKTANTSIGSINAKARPKNSAINKSFIDSPKKNERTILLADRAPEYLKACSAKNKLGT